MNNMNLWRNQIESGSNLVSYEICIFVLHSYIILLFVKWLEIIILCNQFKKRSNYRFQAFNLSNFVVDSAILLLLPEVFIKD